MKTRLLLGALVAATLVAVPACTSQESGAVVNDVAPLAACAENALAQALITGNADPVQIVLSCGGLTLQALANVVRDLLANPAATPGDAGTGGPRDARTAHLQQVKANLAKLGVYAK